MALRQAVVDSKKGSVGRLDRHMEWGEVFRGCQCVGCGWVGILNWGNGVGSQLSADSVAARKFGAFGNGCANMKWSRQEADSGYRAFGMDMCSQGDLCILSERLISALSDGDRRR